MSVRARVPCTYRYRFVKTSMLVCLYCLISSVHSDNKLPSHFVGLEADTDAVLYSEDFTVTDVDISR